MPSEVSKVGHTKHRWVFEQFDGYDALHKLKGTTPEPHEGYFRTNDGSWAVGWKGDDGDGGRIALVDFKGKAKRGEAYCAPDPEGQANARLIASAPQLLEALKAIRLRIEQCWDATPDYLRYAKVIADDAIALAEGGKDASR